MKNVAKVLSFVAIAGIGLAAFGCEKETPKPPTKPAAPSSTPAPTPDKK